MSVRRLLNERPGIAIGLVAVAVVVAGWVVWSYVITTPGSTRIPNACYYTTDDGETWFAESLLKVPPFEHEGKQAVRVVVVQCGDKAPVASYLVRYTGKGKDIIEKYRAEAGTKAITPAATAYQNMMMSGNEIEAKRPGEQQWSTGPAAKAIITATPGCTEVKP